MKLFLQIFTVVLILGILFSLFIWAIAHASGHKIPNELNSFYRNITIGLILILFGTIYYRIKNE